MASCAGAPATAREFEPRAFCAHSGHPQTDQIGGSCGGEHDGSAADPLPGTSAVCVHVRYADAGLRDGDAAAGEDGVEGCCVSAVAIADQVFHGGTVVLEVHERFLASCVVHAAEGWAVAPTHTGSRPREKNRRQRTATSTLPPPPPPRRTPTPQSHPATLRPRASPPVRAPESPPRPATTPRQPPRPRPRPPDQDSHGSATSHEGYPPFRQAR